MPQTRDQIQLSYGRLEDWLNVNPLLLSGEIACVFDNDSFTPIDLRIGNGVLRFADLPSFLTKDFTYSKEEINDLLVAIGERIARSEEQIEGIKTETIPAIQDAIAALNLLVDDSASEENKLTALSTVKAEITSAIEARIGRLLTSSQGQRFPSFAALSSGPYFYNSETTTPRQYDVSRIVGEVSPYFYTGSGWQKQYVSFSAAQQAALDSGVTSDTVSAVARATQDISSLRTTLDTKANKYRVYTHEVLGVNYSGATYYKNTVANLYDGGALVAKAIITADCYSPGAPLTKDKLRVFDTAVSVVTSALTLKTDGDTTETILSTITISSKEEIKDLSDTSSYLQKFVEDFADSRLDRGLVDGKLRVVKNRKLEEIYTARTILYVDGNYEGTVEQGIEVAPFKTIAAALAARSADVAIMVAPFSGYTNPNSQLNLRGRTNTDIVGYAVGSQTPTIISVPVIVGADNENRTRGIGLRDLNIPEFSLQSGSDYYLENVTITAQNVANTIVTIQNLQSSTAKVVFSHCTFKGKLVISSGDVEFDSCDFAIGSTLVVSGAATVTVRDCTGLNVAVSGTATYIQESAILVASSNFALVAEGTSSATPFVGLFSGVALDSLGTSDAQPNYASIQIKANVAYALGSFIYKKENSVLSGSRIDSDGVSTKQVYVGATKTVDTDGYAANTKYLDTHLAGIGNRLKQLADEAGTLSAGITNIQAGTASASGQVKLVVTEQVNKIESRTFDVNAIVGGLGSAAYADANSFASKSIEARVETAENSLRDAETNILGLQRDKQDTSARVTAITNLSTDTQYPTAKAVRTYVDLALSTGLSSLGSRILLPSANPSAVGATTSFATFAALEAGPWYYGGVSTTPAEGDRALYKESDVTNVALYTKTSPSSSAWIFFYATSSDTVAVSSIDFTTAELAALESGVDSDKVTKLDGIQAGAQVNVIEGIKLNGASIAADANKAVNIQLDSSKVGLGNVANTADSAEPEENGTKKFTTGGAYTLSQTLTNLIQNGLSQKVDKVSGKGLSTNDFTAELKAKLENLALVTANPEGTGTSTLTTVKIGDSIYNLPQGGGGSTPDLSECLKNNATGLSAGGATLVSLSGAEGSGTQGYRTIASGTDDSQGQKGYIPTLGKVEDTLASYLTKASASVGSSIQNAPTPSTTDTYFPVYAVQSGVTTGLTVAKLPKVTQDVYVKTVESNSTAVSLESYHYYRNTASTGILLSPDVYSSSSSTGFKTYDSVFLDLTSQESSPAKLGSFEGVSNYFKLPDPESGSDVLRLDFSNSTVAFNGKDTTVTQTYEVSTVLHNSTLYFLGKAGATYAITLYQSKLFFEVPAASASTTITLSGYESEVHLFGASSSVNVSGLHNSTIYLHGDSTSLSTTNKPDASNTVIYLSQTKTLSQVENLLALTFAPNAATQDGQDEDGKFVANLSVPYAATATNLDAKPSITVSGSNYGAQIYVTAGNQNSVNQTVPYSATANKLVAATGTKSIKPDDQSAQTAYTSPTTGIGIGSQTRPVYFNGGLPQEAQLYAGGTKVTLNGTHDNSSVDSGQGDRGAKTVSFYAPKGGGTNPNIDYLESGGANAEPIWATKQTTIHNTNNSASGLAKANVPTTEAVYNALPTVNGASTKPATGLAIYAPLASEISSTDGSVLVSRGTSGAPLFWNQTSDRPKATYRVSGLVINSDSSSDVKSRSYQDSTIIVDLRQDTQVHLSGNYYNCSIVIRGSQTADKSGQYPIFSGNVTNCYIEFQTSRALLCVGHSQSYVDTIMTGCRIGRGKVWTRDSSSGLYTETNTSVDIALSDIVVRGMFVSNRLWSGDNTRPTIISGSDGEGMTFGNWTGSVII